MPEHPSWPGTQITLLWAPRLVAPTVSRACEAGPPRVQDAQVVGVGQLPLAVFAGTEFGFVTVHAVGQHGDRVAHLVIGLLGGFGWQPCPFPLKAIAAGQFRVWAGAGRGSASRGWMATVAPSLGVRHSDRCCHYLEALLPADAITPRSV